MCEKDKKDFHSAIMAGLRSKDTKVVVDSIQKLRAEGRLGDIAVLLDMVLINRGVEVKSAVFEFLADIKDQKARKYIVDAISNERYRDLKKELVGVCWESSLDFSPYVAEFVNLLIDSDFETSFEAFTVIENLVGNVPHEVKQSEQNKLRDAIADAPEDKKAMLHEAIHIIDMI